jgi:hypothetical protein
MVAPIRLIRDVRDEDLTAPPPAPPGQERGKHDPPNVRLRRILAEDPSPPHPGLRQGCLHQVLGLALIASQEKRTAHKRAGACGDEVAEAIRFVHLAPLCAPL